MRMAMVSSRAVLVMALQGMAVMAVHRLGMGPPPVAGAWAVHMAAQAVERMALQEMADMGQEAGPMEEEAPAAALEVRMERGGMGGAVVVALAKPRSIAQLAHP